MSKSDSSSDSSSDSCNSSFKPDRRKFLAGAALSGAAVAIPVPKGGEAQAGLRQVQKAIAPPAAEILETIAMPNGTATGEGRPGSDFMVDVLRALKIEYVATNPASSCRGLHESINNYAMNKAPELLTVMHEESGAAMAHGYAKVTGKPMGLLFHGTVGMQHATMAMYNAWCDRVPMIVMAGNHLDAADRLPGVPTTHAAQDPMAIVRDFTKWDDQPQSLQAYAEAMVRAYQVTMMPPMGPVAISLDGHLQDRPIAEGTQLRIPKVIMPSMPQGESGAVKEAARLLVNATNPVIVVDRAARTSKGMALLVELAETLNAAVIDQLGRQNFPNRHYLSAEGRVARLISEADVILGMELTDFWGTVNGITDNPDHPQNSKIKENTKLISITAKDLYIRANYQDFQRFQQIDIPIAADAEATMLSLIEAIKSAASADNKTMIEKRGQAHRKARVSARDRIMANATLAWDASPISTARLSAEIWAAVKDHDWAMVSRDSSLSSWPHRIWNFEKHYQFIGGPGGAGVGYNLPASVGAALAHREHGRLAVNIQNDGDAMFAPGVLWTAMHHRIPLLTVMHNNRAYHQEVMHVQRLANWRGRGADRQHIGTVITNPDIDFAMLARSMGMTSFGPINDPNELGPVLKKAVEIVLKGEPVLIDVITQPR